ncbi:MAG: PatB family C-S lyase [Bacteroidales bacterium]|jgi:cystathionine beta-lyase|nr:PatB family C-S lyase [Bacteroidales bacterium]
MVWNFDEPVNRDGTNCVKYDLRNEIFGNKDVIPMWVADMDFRCPDFIISAINERLKHEIFGYSFRPAEYFRSISRWLSDIHSWQIEDDWICFCPGVVPALNLCILSFTRPGDSIIVQPPVYPPFFPSVENHGRNLVMNPLKETEGRWTMDFDSLSDLISETTKMIIISNPHNPVGRAWNYEELKKLTDICLKNNILILSDEIHCDLVLPGNVHTNVAGISREVSDITVTCIAPSKTFNLAGLSTSSVIISNPVLRKYFNKTVERIHIGNGNVFGTVASIAAYTEGKEWRSEMLEYLSRNVLLTEEFLWKNIPEIIPVHPEATYMIWLDCRKLEMTPGKLQDFFVKKAGVGLNEGSTFGPGGDGFMRMNLATTRSVVLEALDRIAKAVCAIR